MESWVGRDLRRSPSHPYLQISSHLNYPRWTTISSYEKDLFIFHFNFKHFTDVRIFFIDNLKQPLCPEEHSQGAHVTMPCLGHHGAQRWRATSEWSHTRGTPGDHLLVHSTGETWRPKRPPGRLLPRCVIPFPLLPPSRHHFPSVQYCFEPSYVSSKHFRGTFCCVPHKWALYSRQVPWSLKVME